MFDTSLGMCGRGGCGSPHTGSRVWCDTACPVIILSDRPRLTVETWEVCRASRRSGARAVRTDGESGAHETVWEGSAEVTDDARPEASGLTAVDKYDFDYHLFRHRLVWVLAMAVLTVTGFALLLTTVAAERYYRLDSLVLAVPACWTAVVIAYAYGARRLTRTR